MMVEWSTVEGMRKVRRVKGPETAGQTGLTSRVDVGGLPSGQDIFYRVWFEQGKSKTEPVDGRFRTPSPQPRDVRFFWSGDTAGQGYGINPEWGGMRISETMRRLKPDFFLHSGDTIYADVPIPAEIRLPGGDLWRNVTTLETSKAAQTLDEFRGRYLYNLMDENVRRFNAEVPQLWQWDDHEVFNNWSPGSPLYKPEKVAAARRAFLEFAPLRGRSIYRHIPYGPMLDVFLIDLRSYRAANSHNRQTEVSAGTAYFGARQIQWLLNGLRRSKARWKVIASDLPVGLNVGDGRDAAGRPRFEGSANGDGPALGRELEIAALLKQLRETRVRNTIWLTADVHYTAAHHYHPDRAQFKEFDPFWEFVSGPLNAGTFGPGVLDNTFGPEAVFVKAPPKGQSNLPPSAGLQFFGEVVIGAGSGELTVNLRDLTGAVLFTKKL
jgi:alkaline phosphatase D